MVSQDSLSEYASRMHRVVEYIDQHLDQSLDLVALAKVAHFSPFHFHRLFSAWMGETLGDYLRRRRLEVAAIRLVSQPHMTILQTALSVGFGSAEAFTRAFKARFSCSPTVWRQQQASPLFTNSNLSQVDRKISQMHKHISLEHEISHKLELEIIMQVKLVNRQPVTINYLRHIGPYGASISRFWQDTYYPWAVMNNLLEQPRYGISHDDPSITAPEQCRYDACAEVPSDFVGAGNAFTTTIPGGRYAALSFKGTDEQISAAWVALLREWLPSSGLQLDARPCFEYYPKDAENNFKASVFECEICIPVIPL